MAVYFIANGPAPTSAAQAVVTTGNSVKTMLQVKASATKTLSILAAGISFDGSAAATPIKCEFFESDLAATVTASVQADIVAVDADAVLGGNVTTNLIPVGTTSTGYTSTTENMAGAVVRMFDAELVAPTNQYIFKFDAIPVIQVSKFARIRVTAGAAVNAYCWMLVSV